MLSEFKAFLLTTNALALAIGVIIGAALGTVVTSLVNDIVMPPIGKLLGGVDFSTLAIDLGGGAAIRYGRVPQRVITFIIVAVRRLADQPDVHQGAGPRGGQDLPVLHGAEQASARRSAGPARAPSDARPEQDRLVEVARQVEDEVGRLAGGRPVDEP